MSTLEAHGIQVETIHRNLNAAQCYEQAIRHAVLNYEEGTTIANTGALIAYSGEKTGRSPKDKRIVQQSPSEDDIWWGDINMPISEDTFAVNRERAIDYLNTRSELFVVDAFAGWDPEHRLKVRVVCARPYHALFMYTMLVRPTAEELADFGEPDFTIFNAGQFPANRHTTGMTSKTSINVNFERNEMVVLGSMYAGEMKKGVFTVMNYLMPKQEKLSMHCSATENPSTGKSSILFGLSGTGKTTLSADPHRKLIGDDEHVWSDKGIFNIEGGCYAKAINLTEENEPDIYRAIRYGAVLENVVYDDVTHEVDYTDVSITQNTRSAYPIEHIDNAKIPCVTGHPTDVLFLTCDAFGVLPPVAKLTPEQAMYHFISGYTAKVAGTEMGVTEPEATFSACFGAPFLVWHPNKYAELLASRMREHGSHVWLVNTGWSGGAHGTGSRMPLKVTRAIVDAINSGELANAPTATDPVFGFEVPTEAPGVPGEILIPKNTWADKAAFDATANKLAKLFVENFAQFAEGVSREVLDAAPRPA
jgi:phosphoenolpyruvate carboxykinase (ATP)